MLWIAFSLLSGWILSLFGFKTLLIAGIAQIFSITIGSAGYYTIFALLGMAKSVAVTVGNPINVKNTFKEIKQNKDKGD